MKLNINFRNGKSKEVDVTAIGNITSAIHLNETLGYRVVLTNTSEKLDLRLMKVYDELMKLYGEDVDPTDINIVELLEILDDEGNVLGETRNCTLSYSFVERDMNEIMFFDQRKQVILDISK